MKQIHTLDSLPNTIRMVSNGPTTSFRHRWRYAASAAAVLTAVAVCAVFTSRGGQSVAFADILTQLENVQSSAYTTTVFQNGKPFMETRTYCKSPGLIRVDAGQPGQPVVSSSITDPAQNKMVLLNHSSKECTIYDLGGNVPDPNQIAGTSIFDELRAIADSGAQSIGTKDIDGIQAVGFEANEAGASYVIWVAPDTHQLVLVERQIDTIKGLKTEIRDFDFDAKLDDALFGTEPPEGYAVKDGKTFPSVELSEESFINFLRIYAEESDDGCFLTSLSVDDVKMFGTSKKARAKNMTEAEAMKRTAEISSGLGFAAKMTPENDFHYAAKGVALGDAKKPICWYKPSGEQDYRVIYGDLSVRVTIPKNLPPAPAQ